MTYNPFLSKAFFNAAKKEIPELLALRAYREKDAFYTNVITVLETEGFHSYSKTTFRDEFDAGRASERAKEDREELLAFLRGEGKSTILLQFQMEAKWIFGVDDMRELPFSEIDDLTQKTIKGTENTREAVERLSKLDIVGEMKKTQ